MPKTFLPALLPALVLSLFPAPAAPQEPLDAPEPTSNSVPDTSSPAEPARRTYALEAVRTGEPIAIDGSLDDAGWRGAERVSGFHEAMPQDGRRAAEDTEVWVAHDESNLYIAFRAQAPRGAVRASLGQRDKVHTDDLVLVSIDPRGTDEWAYAFGANPLGVQVDGRGVGIQLDPGLDLVYTSAGRLTDQGFDVEMAIPFSSLQAKPGERAWKINFVRAHPRQTRFISSWSPILRSNPCTLCQAGTIAGFEGVKSAGTWSLLPAMVAHQASRSPEAGTAMEHGRLQAEPSLGAAYRMAGGWSFEGTYNPDFSQVESDVAQIDVNSTLALSYPEKRPFFQEGSELFATPMRTLYTRAINDPKGAGKVTGRVGDWQVGYLGAYDETSPYFVPLRERTLVGRAGSSQSHIVRAKRPLGEGSFFGAMLTDRSYSVGARGTTLGIDGVQRFASVYKLEYQLLGSRTREGQETIPGVAEFTFAHGGDTYTAAQDGEQFAGYGGRIALERNDGLLQVGASYGFATPTLQAANGFLRRNDYRDVELFAGMSIQPATGLFDDISPRLELGREWSYAGAGQRRYVEPGLMMRLKGQTVVGLNYYRADEIYRDTRFDGLDKATVLVQSRFSDRVGVGMHAKYGDDIVRLTREPLLGREFSAAAWLSLKPAQQVVITPRFAFARMHSAKDGEEIYQGSISRLDASYQVNRELSVRLTGQYNSFRDRLEVDPLITYQISPFSMFYIGSTHDLLPADPDQQWALSERQIFLKFQYLFRR